MEITRHTPKWRLQVLRETRQLGNVAEVCKKHGMDRTTFYKLEKRCALLPEGEWLAALEDRPREWKTHGQQTPETHRKLILGMAREHPEWGCNRIERELKKSKIKRSHNAVQKILNGASIGTRRERWFDLDKRNAQVSEEQATFIAEFNPNYRDRTIRKSRPGALLFADAVKIGPFDGLGMMLVYVVIDSYSSHAWCSIRKDTSSDRAVWVLKKRCTPDLMKAGHRIQAISNRSGPGFGPPYFKFLGDHKIRHISDQASGSGYIERFRAAVERGFVLGSANDQKFASIDELQKEFLKWWRAYNGKRHDGFPCYGRSPLSMLQKSVG